jgi:hypothetical protein
VFSLLTLYTLLMQVGILTGGAFIWKHRIEYIRRENPNFGQAMIEATFLGVFISLFLSPFVQLPESGKTAKYVSSWTDYQVNIIQYERKTKRNRCKLHKTARFQVLSSHSDEYEDGRLLGCCAV